MKATLALLAVALHPALAGAADLSGAWVSCDPKSPWAYVLLSVDQDGAGYRWTSEWGAPYAADGPARLEGDVLVLRGCSSYRGEVASNCDEKNPPIYARLRKEDFDRKRSHFTAADLATAKWVSAGKGDSWQHLARQCEEIAAKLGEGQEGAKK